MNLQSRVVAARWILPISSEPINGGWIRMRGLEVAEIGKGPPPIDAEDLGDVAILPGLINAHTHLEFSDCREPIGAPGIELHDWIGRVIATRSKTSADTKRDAIEIGLRESRDAGVRLVGEITTTPYEYPPADGSPELVTFAEVLGLSSARGDERLAAAISHNDSYENGAWSPHAPYSTSLSLVDSCAELARQSNRPIAMHVAESPAERELLQFGTGPFAATLGEIGVWQEDLFPWGDDPFEMLIDRLSIAPRALLIHGNDYRGNEIAHIKKYPQMTVVYCPRTHAFFRHPAHPVGDLVKSGVNVAIGTDSRASNPDLSVWAEVQFLLNHRQDLAPSQVLRMATINGAEAFGRHDLGRIEVGCQVGLGCVKTEASNVEELYAGFVERGCDFRVC